MRYFDSTQFNWEEDSYVMIRKIGLNAIELQANVPGLLSLASQLVQIAKEEYNSVFYQTGPGDLEEGSIELQISKIDIHGR